MFNGTANILKPPGISSFALIQRLRWLLDEKKVGHTGTLDPAAAGVLGVCFGKATKIIPFLDDSRKEYICEMQLGFQTDTLDLDGKIIKEDLKWNYLTKKEVESTILNFKGKQKQIPPMYSALHYQGKRLYELARKGIEVERESRDIEIFDLEILEINLPLIRFKVEVSRGTYIRSLVRDIGKYLKTNSVMTFLLRTKSGPFKLKNTLSYEEIEKGIDAGITVANHMYNAMRGLHHRRPGTVGGYLTDDRVTCEIIGDLIHVHPAVIDLTLRAKGLENVYLISDAILAAGLPAGKYSFAGREITINKKGVSRLQDGTIAGSTMLLSKSIVNLIKSLDLAMTQVVKLASENPAKAAGVFDRKGSIVKGKDADLIVLDENYKLKYSFVKGNVVNKPDKKVEIDFKENDKYKFFVKDNGHGIKEKNKEQVFKLFENTGKENEGKGAGLTICKKIVEDQGGRIWIEPTDNGTTVKFTLSKS